MTLLLLLRHHGTAVAPGSIEHERRGSLAQKRKRQILAERYPQVSGLPNVGGPQPRRASGGARFRAFVRSHGTVGDQIVDARGRHVITPRTHGQADAIPPPPDVVTIGMHSQALPLATGQSDVEYTATGGFSGAIRAPVSWSELEDEELLGLR